MSFRIKICGITRVDDALRAVAAGADAIGLNFYPGSPRVVSLDKAAEIAKAVAGRATVVGVFVNSDVGQIIDCVARVPLDLVQLHGDEPPEFAAALSGQRCLRAFRCRTNAGEAATEIAHITSYVECCRQQVVPLAGILLDAYQPGNYGGTGQALDWIVIGNQRAEFPPVPLILAGGLTAENVAQAIQQARPDGVDTASGVEASPGIKDAARLTAFVHQADRALALLAAAPAASDGDSPPAGPPG